MATEKRLKAYDPITFESFTRHITKHREPYDYYDEGYTDAVDNIDDWLEANTVDAVEVVHGRWKSICLAGGFSEEWGYVCSECGCTVSERSGLGVQHFRTNQRLNYCPNCGAKMDREMDSNLLFADMEEIIDATD